MRRAGGRGAPVAGGADPELGEVGEVGEVKQLEEFGELEEFELDRACDYEHERLLMYRVILAAEAVAAIVLFREIVLRLH